MTAVMRREHNALADLLDWVEDSRIHPMPGWPALAGARNGIRLEEHVEQDKYVLRAELPGIDPDEDVKITVADGKLTLEAERREEKQEGSRTEFRYGALARRVLLPAGAREDTITATYVDGILEITVPIDPDGAKPVTVPIARGTK
jgi:HSP20 family molecular chaperone IbpA